MKYAKRRVLCIVLSLVVAITMAPYIGFADGEDVDWGIEFAGEDNEFYFSYDDIEEGTEFNLQTNIYGEEVNVDELGITYQWYVSSGYDEETEDYIWNDIAGATGDRYTAIMTETKAVGYKCTATDKNGNSASCFFWLYYEAPDVEWEIYNACEEGELEFTYADIKRKKEFTLETVIEEYDSDVSDLGITYQWSVRGKYDEETGKYVWDVIAGATEGHYKTVVTGKKDVVYKCVATDRFGNSDWCTFELNYNASGGDPFWKLKKNQITKLLSEKNVKIYIQNGIKADKPFKATSSNNKIAKVKIVNNSYAYVTFIKQGTVTIKVTDANGNSATCKIKVIKSNITSANYPDAEFRRYIKKKVDTNKDGRLSNAEIRRVTTIIIPESYSVKNLKGVEKFYNLKKLIDRHDLKKVVLTKNKKLKKLILTETNVRELNLSKNKNLEHVNCSENKLKTLILPKTGKLKKLDCQHNKLRKLDVRGCKSLVRLNAGENYIKTLKLGTKKRLTHLYLGANKLKKINVSKFPKLKELDLYYNKLSKLNLKKNKELKYLYCGSNKIKKLNVEKNRKLKELYCYDNRIKRLNVKKNKKLTYLSCNYNKLTKLDVSKCLNLISLEAEHNKLKKVDVRKCKKIRSVCLDADTKFIHTGTWNKGLSRGGGIEWWR
ncbi:MAG: leucine-rich repeat domain-containing protein [Firmicutes bacterium]|nr:leucine-rich repeat domain-containing protein [Bacillota bacterium]